MKKKKMRRSVARFECRANALNDALMRFDCEMV
jgi:hypothetical protein